MIHLDRTFGPEVLDMTSAAVLSISMEGSGLLAEIGGGGGVAGNAGGRFDASHGRVTRFAFTCEGSVLCRQQPWLEKLRP